jgi:hypothetical protein
MRTGVIVTVVALATAGCVSKGKYDEAVAQTNVTRAELARKNVTMDQMSADLAGRQQEILALSADAQ